VGVYRLFAVEGVAIGGAFARNTVTGVMPVAHRVGRLLTYGWIVIYQQEVSPMNAVSAVGAPPPSTISRLR
jgi:hypothetical protein